MDKQLKRFACDTVCGFSVQSYDEEEIVKIVSTHVQTGHPDITLPEEKLRSIIEAVK